MDSGSSTRPSATRSPRVGCGREWDAEQGSGVAADGARAARQPARRAAPGAGSRPPPGASSPPARSSSASTARDPAFDFGPVIGAFAKALEVQCRAVLRRALAKAPREARLANVNGQTVDIVEQRTLTLGQLCHALSTEQRLAAALTAVARRPRLVLGPVAADPGGVHRGAEPGRARGPRGSRDGDDVAGPAAGGGTGRRVRAPERWLTPCHPERSEGSGCIGSRTDAPRSFAALRMTKWSVLRCPLPRTLRN